jgi:cell division cycle 20-like protein 1 (cofactor of APC complex)
MSGLKNSPFGKRLRASHREPALTTTTVAATATVDNDLASSSTTTTPNRVFNPIFGISSTPSLTLREYGDRFVPFKDSGDLRTSYHLMEEGGGGPSTPSKSRIIPSESDALKGALSHSCL